MTVRRKKLENANTEEEKSSHLPCAGIILFRFYGYYLSQIFLLHAAGEYFSTPGTLEYRFSAGKAKICIGNIFVLIK
jgi:hypothetical protein